MFSIFKRKSTPQPLFFHTDIHCHIIPGIDDGARNLDESLQLVDAMADLGFSRIFASPHITQGTFENTPDTIAGPFRELREALTAKGSPVQLEHWAENRIDDILYQNVAEGKLLSIPGDRVLIENSFMQEPWNLDKLVFDLQVKGYTPILAHPERYSYYRGRADYLNNLVQAGLSFQVNLLSLAGQYGPNEKKAAETLIERGLVRYLGSDIHRMQHVETIKNYLSSKDYDRHRKLLEGKILNDKI